MDPILVASPRARVETRVSAHTRFSVRVAGIAARVGQGARAPVHTGAARIEWRGGARVGAERV